jgi:hypothetical protein
MSSVPVEAKQRMVSSARNTLVRRRSALPLRCVIPVSADDWSGILIDAGLELDALTLESELSRLIETATSRPEALRSAASDFVGVVEPIAEQLWFIQAFASTAPNLADALRYALIDAAVIALDVASGCAGQATLEHARIALAAAADDVRAISTTFEFPDDLCLAAFGVAYPDLTDERGVFSPSRLLAAYYGRYPQLAIRIGTLLSVLTEHPPDIMNALGPAEALALSERKLVTLRTAVRTRDLFLLKMGEDMAALVRPLRELKLTVERSAASHAALVRLIGQRDQVQTGEDRAVLSLDVYRRMIEGQLRSWCWTLLQIGGRTASKPPELSSLREQLIAEGNPLLLDAASAILPHARNAAAHEDYAWDDEQAVLTIGDTTIDPADLDDAAVRAYAFVIGAEATWRCARTASAEFAALLDSQDRQGGLPALNVRLAVDHFGTNGLLVRRWAHDAGTLTVVLEDIDVLRINPCFQAVMWASRHLERTERFIVSTPDAPCSVMDLPRQPLEATFVVWCEAARRFSVMPLSTFLPASAWARMAVESPDVAAHASAWHALNDAVHAYNEALESVESLERRLLPLIDRLDLVTTAVAATLSTLPEQAGGPLLQVIELTRPAAAATAAVLHGLSSVDAARLEDHIRDLRESWPSAAVLPTVDPTPLS